MKHSHTARNYAKAFFAFATIGMIGACADSAVAPRRDVAFKAPPGFDRTVGVKVFSINANHGTTQVLGNHTISIPGDAICNPELSTYGVGEWDEPCAQLNGSIEITATMLEDNAGNPYVDFQPALRFVPTKEVNLFLTGADTDSTTMLNIEYCNNLGFCMDESTTDSSLVTRRLPNSSVAVRRIKHFSGYMISSGLPCEVNCEGGFAPRRSGYMVASGAIKGSDSRITNKKRADR